MEAQRVSAIVVYESHWGNTAAVAEAIAEGLGDGALAVDTDAASGIEHPDLIVAGAPVIAFGLARESSRSQIAADNKGPRAPDVTHPLLREWLDRLPAEQGWYAAFETRIWWSPRGATGTIESKLKKAGYQRLVPSERFVVGGSFGPMREGELDRAREWGAAMAEKLAAVAS
jgi:hypothetical protein